MEAKTTEALAEQGITIVQHFHVDADFDAAAAARAAADAGRELRLLQVEGIEWRESGSGDDYTFKGHAAVFNKLSGDLGGFRELIEPGFFRSALRKNPDVRLLINHDANLILARTASGTLELREDQKGLHAWAKVGKTSYARDLRIAMQRGDLDQMSFAFTIVDGGDDWAIAEDGTIVRTLRADGADEIYDVSVVVYAAYPATDAAMRTLARALNVATPDEVLRRAQEIGRLPDDRELSAITAGVVPAAPDEPADGKSSSASPPEGADELQVAPEEDEAGPEARTRAKRAALEAEVFEATALAKADKRRFERGKYALRTRED